MKITICYEKGHSHVAISSQGVGCRVYGFENQDYTVEDNWVVYSIYELPDTPQLANALVDAIVLNEVEYRDPKFSTPVPESACVVSGLLDMLLARDDYAAITYTSYTRKWRSDKWTEVKRRIVADKEVDSILQCAETPSSGRG